MSQDIVARFLRLSPETRHSLAERFALFEPDDAKEPDDVNRAHRWLRRASSNGMLDGEFGAAVLHESNPS